MSPYLQQRNDSKSKNRNSNNDATNINALINEIESIKWLEDDANGPNSTSSNEVDSKYESVSDNGSEISDEGYRSLGLTQQENSSANKQAPVNGKTHSGPDGDVRIDGMKSRKNHF